MRFLNGFVYAWNGLKKAILEEGNLQIQLVMLSLAVALGFYFDIAQGEWIAIILAGGLVISLELANTAVENLTDMVSLESSPLAGKIKDISAAAVLIAAVASLIVGFIIFVPHIKLFFGF